MKYLLAITSLLLLSSSNLLDQLFPNKCSSNYTSDLTFQFNLSKQERSKDSHTYTYKMTYNGSELSYYGPYGKCVRGRCQHKRFKLNLSEQEILELKKTLRELSAFKEKKPAQSTGRAITTNLSYRIKNRITQIAITGMTRNWKTRQSNLSKQALDKVDKLKDLQRLVTKFVKKCHPTAH